MGALGGLVFGLLLVAGIKLTERRWPDRSRAFHVWTAMAVALPVAAVLYLGALALID